MRSLTRFEFECLSSEDQKSYSEKAYVEVCREIDEELKSLELYRCQGCLGRHRMNYLYGNGRIVSNKLDHHHVWRRSDAPLWYHFQRSNIILLCRVCHERIDGILEQQKSLICYNETLQIIEQLKQEDLEWRSQLEYRSK